MKSQLGSLGEDLAASYYRQLGYKIIERNFIFPYGKRIGELDLVALRDNELVFIEVKTLRGGKFGGPFEAVDFSKQRKLAKMAKLYLNLNSRFQGFDYRIDVASVDIDNRLKPVIILENAVEDYE
jgi:putative endonuclease